MAIKVGINGFGRIGRMVFRAAVKNFADIEIVGINDLLEPDYLAYMLQYDSVHRKFEGKVAVDGNTLIVNGKKTVSYTHLDVYKRQVKARAQRKKEQHQKKIAQRFEAVGDVERNRAAGQRHPPDKSTDGVGQSRQRRDFRDA